ncbi:ScbA/BarX family gamma-butyrolactone biosynthesis protein [Streptomyces sp. NPDC091272]|uniref:ScbA/BarX family gamma-butyrolactone biosynthesis protein n=1 Tax=Streptomyces sp. NPDC091272 TaxID=3365981 RepID=UPI0037F79E7D
MTVVEERPAPTTLLRSVPQEYVHKRNAAEVLLSGWTQTRANEFVVTALWPRVHPLYCLGHGLYDPMLFAETVRQCIPLLSHAGYQVPVGHHLIWQHLTFEVDPSAMYIDERPGAVTLHLTCSDVTVRSGRLAALTMRVTALRDGIPMGTAEARFSSHSPAIYRRLRAGSGEGAPTAAASGALPGISPDQAGRVSAGDVVLAETGVQDRWLLRSDTTHPLFFDHPVDHVPGMLLLEAARQAAHAQAWPLPLYPYRLASTFFQYVEFNSDCHITASPLPAGHGALPGISMTAEQGGVTAFTSTVTTTAR